MLRHLLILVREHFSLPGTMTIALDRHLSRGEHLEIVPDRRHPPEPNAAPWVAGRERRRASAVDDQLHAQGYAIISRDDDGPPPPPPRPLERAPVARPEPVGFGRPEPPGFGRGGPAPIPRDEPRALRHRLGRDLDEDLDDRDDYDEQDDDLRRARSGGLLLAILLVIGALVAGIFYFSAPARDRLASTLAPGSPPPATAPPATPPTPATPATPPAEEPARPAPGAADSSAPTPAPALPAPTAPPAAAPPAAVPPRAAPAPDATRRSRATTEERAPAAPAAPDVPARDLPPRRTEAPAVAERAPDPAPQSARSQRLPEFPGLPRVEVSRAPSAEGTTFTVRLTDPRGRALTDAQVWLRQQSPNGVVRETPLEPVAPAGSYRGAVPVTAGRESLTVRIDLGDRRVEMPVGE